MQQYSKIDRQMYPLLKHLGRDRRWGLYLGGKYTDAQTIGDYKVEIEHDNPDFERILLWNPERPCVAMDHDKPDNYAAINVVHYDPRCTIDGDMKRGSGTKKMLDFALEFLKTRGVKKVQLTDRSTIDCNGMKVSLKLMYFLKHGETWYEKNFGFKPAKEYADDYEQVKNERIRLLNITLIKKEPCEFFTPQNLKVFINEIGFQFHDSIVWEKTL